VNLSNAGETSGYGVGWTWQDNIKKLANLCGPLWSCPTYDYDLWGAAMVVAIRPLDAGCRQAQMHALYQHTWESLSITGISAGVDGFGLSWSGQGQSWPLAGPGPKITVCGDGAGGGGACPCNGPGYPTDPGDLSSVGYPTSPGSNTSAARQSDLNGDGKADLLAIYEGSGGLYWYPGKGDGSFWSARYIDQAGFRHMELADVNGDGKQDMIAIYNGNNMLAWYPGKGDGAFWSARELGPAGFKLMTL
jgi:FG-GAP-like repeat